MSDFSAAACTPLAFFEDCARSEAWSFSGWAETLTARDQPSLAAAFSSLRQWQQQGDWAVLALDYELGYLLEPAAAPAWWPGQSARPVLSAWRFRTRQALSGETAIEAHLARLEQAAIAHAGTGDKTASGVAALHPAMTSQAYQAAVRRIRDYIAAGDCYQVNYTFPLHFDWFGQPLSLYRALRQRQPVRYGGLILHAQADGVSPHAAHMSHILSLSPELFVEKQGHSLITRPMKGTAKRQADPLQDAAAKSGLQASEKNRAENLMIVDLLRNDLGRLARPGSVTVERLFEVETYPSLFQMVSQIRADAGQQDFAACLRALFPCGSITGAPKIRAMQIAAELETGPRGGYTGSLGWLAPTGDFRLNVAIRTLYLEETATGKTGTLGIGSGIVTDSDPADEWAECLLKADFLRQLDPGVQLIETLRLEITPPAAGKPATAGYPFLGGHLARLQQAASDLGFSCNLPAIAEALHRCAETCLTGWDSSSKPQQPFSVWRVRLTLDKSGHYQISHAPLDCAAPPPDGWRARLAATRIDSRHLLRRYKTTDRAGYDQALASLTDAPDTFDLIFLNERGEVAEGARSTVFWAPPEQPLQAAGQPFPHLLTPPLDGGALPGVLRGQLLASGQAVEAVLYPEQLRQGQLYLGNALRGLHMIAPIQITGT